MKSLLIALGSIILVNLSICKAIRWITTIGNDNMLFKNIMISLFTFNPSPAVYFQMLRIRSTKY